MAQAPQPSPQQEQSPQDQQQDASQGQGGGDVGGLINACGKSLSMLQQMFSSSPNLKDEAQLAGQLMQGFEQLVSMLQGGQDQGQAQGGAGVQPQEAGNAPVKPAL